MSFWSSVRCCFVVFRYEMSARFGQRALRLFFRCLSISGGCCLDNHERFLTSFYLLLRRLFWLSADLSEELLACREIPWTACRTDISTVYFIVVFAFGNIDFLRNFCPVFALVADLFSFFSAYGRNVWADIAVTLCFSAVFRRGTSGPL